LADTGGTYKKISALVDDWIAIHAGESFTLDLICRQLNINERENRKQTAVKLNHEVKQGILEKNNPPHTPPVYTSVSKDIKYIDWVNVKDTLPLDFKFPYGIEDNSEFGFSDKVVISPGDVIVVAGVSNMGKTTMVLNMLWENMDCYPCVLMGNEYTPGKFARRVARMTWKEPTNGNGLPKFELIDRRERWWDAIKPGHINFIDWINLEDNFYQIGMIIDKCQQKVGDGVLVPVIQKSPTSTLGRGGGFSKDLASLYLTLDFNRLTIEKAKEWHTENPNNKMYGFTIVDGGSKFHNIREIVKCKACWGKGMVHGSECGTCQGTGYCDKEYR